MNNKKFKKKPKLIRQQHHSNNNYLKKSKTNTNNVQKLNNNFNNYYDNNNKDDYNSEQIDLILKNRLSLKNASTKTFYSFVGKKCLFLITIIINLNLKKFLLNLLLFIYILKFNFIIFFLY